MRRRSVLIIVQNLPVPLDRRVWLECQALRAVGYEVSVICPKGPGDVAFQELDGVSIYKYKPAPDATGMLSYLFEFVYSWIRTAWLSLRVYRQHRFTVIQACNPPDTYWALAALWRIVGVRFVFDQHDLNPELFRSRFGEPKSFAGRVQLSGLYWLERMTYRVATHVIVTNQSYKDIAMRRGELAESSVTVVRSGPNTRSMRPVPGEPELRRGAQHLLAYVGIMGPQDNVDVLLKAMNVLVHEMQRTDVHLVLMGFGDCLADLRTESTALGLDEFVTFTGRVDQATIARYLSTAHVGLAPDLKTPLNDASTHNKTMEYMAYALPIVSFDLKESRVSAAESSVYVESGDIAAFAKAIDELLDDTDRRVMMGGLARTRCVTEMDWEPQSRAYVGVFDGLFSIARESSGPAQKERTSAGPLPVVAGRTVIDLRDPADFESFLRTRGLTGAELQSIELPSVSQD